MNKLRILKKTPIKSLEFRLRKLTNSNEFKEIINCSRRMADNWANNQVSESNYDRGSRSLVLAQNHIYRSVLQEYFNTYSQRQK